MGRHLHSLRDFFAYVREKRTGILRRHQNQLAFCRALIAEDLPSYLPTEIKSLLSKLDADHRDYAVGSAYALLIGDKKRKSLSAYFTPPVLSQAVLNASLPYLNGVSPRVLDPSCGGGSFITPVARHLIAKQQRGGASKSLAISRTLAGLKGIEIDAGLAALSQSLLLSMLEREFQYTHKGRLNVVRCADALTTSLDEPFDLIIGNPPYGKVFAEFSGDILKRAGRANIGGHTNLYSLFLLRSLDWLKPSGGLVFVIPTSFVAGPYFAGLREEILARADVMSIDLHEQRDNLFLGAVQDVCLLTLQRHESGQRKGSAHTYELGYIDANGARRAVGRSEARPGGEPWILPASSEVKVFTNKKDSSSEPAARTFTLGDYGYDVRVGKVVPTRERDDLHDTKENGDVALVWASAIRPDASFDHRAAKRLGNALWYGGSPGAPTKRPSVVVQRTSNRDQRRRLNAAAVPKKFLTQQRKGFVAENHVIVLEARSNKPKIPSWMLAELLNSGPVNERFALVSGSFTVSAKLLQRLALPDPELVKQLSQINKDHELRKLFAAFPDILSSQQSDGSRDAQNAVNQSRDLSGRAAVDNKTRLKRRSVS